MTGSPFKIVATSATFYAVFLGGATRLSRQDTFGTGDFRVKVKAISAAHSAATALCAIYLLRKGEWVVSKDLKDCKSSREQSSNLLDDSTNPTIAGQSTAANALTAWEVGYLIYDTIALLVECRHKYNTPTVLSTVVALAKHSPIFFAHHVALIAALLYLQHYIRHGWEKGLWVIVAMLAMNASNPILHLRWWYKKNTGRNSLPIDILLATFFAASRFGNVYWILKKYGEHHGIAPMKVLWHLRWQCRTGTGLLVGVNAVWWLGLVRSILDQSAS